MRPGTFSIFLLLLLLCCYDLRSQPGSGKDSMMVLQMFKAIRTGNAKDLESLLKAGANPNAVLNNYSALMAATLNGTPEQIDLLLQHGAHVNYCNTDSISAIWLAIPDPEKTAVLIRHGANVNQRSREGNTLLVKLAAIPGSAALIKTIVAAGGEPRNTGRANNALYNAASSGDTAVLGYFIRAGVPVNDTNSFGDYPINASLNYRSFATLKMLVDSKADVNPSPSHGILPLVGGVTPLMWAAVSNDKDSFYYLLNHGANAKATSPAGYTTLMFLARSQADDAGMTKTLLDRGVDPAAKALDGTDALLLFKQRGNTASVDLLNQYIGKK